MRSVREEVSYRDRNRCRVVDRCRLLGAWAATGEPCVRCVNETLLIQKEALGMTTTTYTPHDNARESKISPHGCQITPPRDGRYIPNVITSDVCGFPVHDLVAQREEPFRGQRFSKEICEVLVGFYVRHDDFTIFHHLSDKEMPPINMFSACMMLWIVSKITSPFLLSSKSSIDSPSNDSSSLAKRFK